MKTIPIQLQASRDTGVTHETDVWRITRRDGAIFGFTSHDRAITFDGTRFAPSSAFDPSAMDTRSEFNVDGGNLVGVLNSEGIVSTDIEAGLWDGAAIELLRLDWTHPEWGCEIVLTGQTGVAQRRTGRYEIEIRGLMLYLQNALGRLVRPSCDADLGDARCKVNIEALRQTGTVHDASDARTFTAGDLAQPADWFTLGVVTWVTGDNAGRSMEVKSQGLGTGSPTGNAFVLQLKMFHPIQVGDVFTVVPGCDKTKQTCIDKFDNLLNFRGFSFVPGQNKVLLVGGQ